jgi:pimeloyl-ACP methyl ester carboxylesterase
MSGTQSLRIGSVNVVDHPGEGPAFVLMHGFPDDHHIYDRLVPLLAPRRVVAFDFTGYGASARATAGAPIAANPRDDLPAVIDGLDLERVALVGHDASGPIALDYAAEHPERVVSLTLLDTYYGHAPALRLPEMIRLLADAEMAPLADAMMDDLGQRLWLLQHTNRQFGGSDDLPPDGIAAVSILPQFFETDGRPDAIPAIRAWTGALFEDQDEQDRRIADGRLKAISVPVKFVIGEDDQYVGPALAHQLAGHFADADVHVVPNASHWVQWDQPDAVAKFLLAD